jgi:two-component system phosphate regulon sensor histidine kinase PhoR
MLAGMREGVLLLGEDRRVDRMNAAFREMFYLSTGDPQGKSLLELIRHSELKSLVDDAFDARGGAEGEIDVGGLSPRRLLVRATFIEGVGVLAVFFDVTEIRALEVLRREFVANVSHELRTPVTAVLSAAETARMIAARDPAKAEPFLEIIERNAERLRRLIEDLLDLSRIESNKLKLVPETVELTSFLPMTTALFKERATARRITLTVTASAGVRVRADRRALEQVVTNLVDNAIKYVRDGDEVRVLAEKVGDDVRIVVADSGEGIAAEHLPRLFERFYRVDAGRSRDKGGTGLGLAIVKHLAESMGGAIAVESSRAGATVLGFPSGTAFIVTLPAG